MSVSNLRRKYDTGTIGRSYSAKDVELSKHKVENETFMKGRSDYKKFGEPFGTSSNRLRLQVNESHGSTTEAKHFS